MNRFPKNSHDRSMVFNATVFRGGFLKDVIQWRVVKSLGTLSWDPDTLWLPVASCDFPSWTQSHSCHNIFHMLLLETVPWS